MGVKVGRSDEASIYANAVGQEMNLSVASIEPSMTFSSKPKDKSFRALSRYIYERYNPTRLQSLHVAIQTEAIGG